MSTEPTSAAAPAQNPDATPSLNAIADWEDVPKFAGPEEEALFWQKHQVESRLMLNALAAADHTDSTTITLRIDPRMLSRLKRLAKQRYLNYQSMLKQWVAERLEQESD